MSRSVDRPETFQAKSQCHFMLSKYSYFRRQRFSKKGHNMHIAFMLLKMTIMPERLTPLQSCKLMIRMLRSHDATLFRCFKCGIVFFYYWLEYDANCHFAMYRIELLLTDNGWWSYYSSERPTPSAYRPTRKAEREKHCAHWWRKRGKSCVWCGGAAILCFCWHTVWNFRILLRTSRVPRLCPGRGGSLRHFTTLFCIWFWFGSRPN